MVAADYTSIATEVTAQLALAIGGGVAILGTILGLRTGVRVFRSFTKG